MLHIITDYIYENFRENHLAICEGKGINSTVGINLRECQELCDKNNTCLSFSFCGNGNGTCNLKDKILYRSDQKVYSDNCTSYYKKCDGNLLLHFIYYIRLFFNFVIK